MATEQKQKGQKMKKTGATLVRHALEQLGIRHTFGIPGVHTTEIYDELNRSETVTPVLVTHAASGIGEAGIDGIPMLIISDGIHSASGHRYLARRLPLHCKA
jgi:acetolactate synthase-1/2/3 large subunit